MRVGYFGIPCRRLAGTPVDAILARPCVANRGSCCYFSRMEASPSAPERLPRTRILATLGPGTSSRESIRDLVQAGASAFRLNFSHGKHEDLATLVEHVRSVSQELNRNVALVGDLSGPKLRTGPVAGGGAIELVDGQEVIVRGDPGETVEGVLHVDYRSLATTVKRGQMILLDDGNLELEVLAIHGEEVKAKVVHGGPLKSHKGLNLPGSQVDIPAITEKDERDLAFALEQGIDWVAISFVQTARDITDLKRRIAQAGKDTPVIAKIEKPVAVENLDSIMEVTDAIMVARGDLGVEVGPEGLPVLQKRIIHAARKASKLVITATQMLDSMTHSPRPTRAEASDVANAIFDGTDVVMLSQETAVGSFPVRTVATMRDIALQVEDSELYMKQQELLQRPESEGVAHAAIRAAAVAAEQVEAKAVVLFTNSGWTAINFAAWRPHNRVFVLTPRPETSCRLALAWGIRTVRMPQPRSLQHMYNSGMKLLMERGVIEDGDLVVVVSGSVVKGTGANTIKITRVGADDLKSGG